MRKLAFVLAASLLAGLGAVAPATAPTVSAATGPKVAIIVGATHGATAQYRSYADQVYAEAIKHTPNVVRVYSPNATWTRVKAAVNGASIIVYLGHGNGWPSPYTYDPNYTTKDGFGLNYDLNGDGKLTDYENKYYGEPAIRTLTPAPNALVLLFHLCYASGNSEPGGAAPSVTTAKQRVDNYGAAFLRAGARAVVAIGHSHSPYYIRELFTTRQTIESYFLNAPDANGNVLAYPSSRSPGYSILMDPDAPTSSFYRSVTGNMALTTRQVTGGAYTRTDVDPATFVVPGNASPASDGAPVYASLDDAVGGLEPAATADVSDRVRIDAQEEVTALADGSAIFRVHLDRGVEGWMTASSLVPRDMLAPLVWEVDDGNGAFSPNGDGSLDTYALSVRLSEASAWTLRIEDRDGRQLASRSGDGDVAEMTWAPTAGSQPDGEYHWVVTADDAWGNGPMTDQGTFQLDTEAPAVSVADASAATVPVFSPNGDGYQDTIGFSVGASEPGRVIGAVRDGGDQVVDEMSVVVGSGAAGITWDGRDASGQPLDDGLYTVAFQAEDRAGNRSEAQLRAVAVYAPLSRVRTSSALFFPQDGDNLSSQVTLAFELASAANITWTVVDSAGAPVRTIMTDQRLEAGSQRWSWDGRSDSGAFVPRGVYTTVVRASDGDLSASGRASVRADAFRIALSDSTPYRGQRITVTITSAESLAAAPRLAVYQPGISAWTIGTVKVATNTYRVTIRLKWSSLGTVRLRAYGIDTGRRSQSSAMMYIRLH